ncbi:hypothetical protein [Streptomyces sp. C184]|uniref:hypothetical protein n=1 Tax=Streptomyces sp. C184 TaxID=3237121 RepID=UPI0034C5DD91
MSAAQQHLLDTYRAARRSEAAPPAPGTHTVRTAREIREWFRFQAVVTDPGDRFVGRVRRSARRAGRRARAVRGVARRLVRLLQV